MLFEFNKLLTLYMTSSNILQNAVSKKIGLWLDMQNLLPFSCDNLTFEHLSHSQKIPAAIG
jgi:hypothetical protein